MKAVPEDLGCFIDPDIVSSELLLVEFEFKLSWMSKRAQLTTRRF
jgi:hypothetical protein